MNGKMGQKGFDFFLATIEIVPGRHLWKVTNLLNHSQYVLSVWME